MLFWPFTNKKTTFLKGELSAAIKKAEQQAQDIDSLNRDIKVLNQRLSMVNTTKPEATSYDHLHDEDDMIDGDKRVETTIRFSVNSVIITTNEDVCCIKLSAFRKVRQIILSDDTEVLFWDADGNEVLESICCRYKSDAVKVIQALGEVVFNK
jgi:hypothetical protein